MVEHFRHLKSFFEHAVPIIIISDEQTDKTGKTIEEPVLVFAAEGERIGYMPISELQAWINVNSPSEIFKALTKDTNREEDFVVQDYGREYAIDQGMGMRMVRYSSWRLDRPNVRGYGKTPNESIYDLTHNVQPL